MKLLTQKEEEEEEEEGNESEPDDSSCLQFLPVATRGVAAQNKANQFNHNYFHYERLIHRPRAEDPRPIYFLCADQNHHSK